MGYEVDDTNRKKVWLPPSSFCSLELSTVLEFFFWEQGDWLEMENSIKQKVSLMENTTSRLENSEERISRIKDISQDLLYSDIIEIAKRNYHNTPDL